MSRRRRRGGGALRRARIALTAVALLIAGTLVTLVPSAPSSTATAAVRAQETAESSSPPSAATPSRDESPVESVSPSARTITIESPDEDPINYRDQSLVRGVISSDNPSCVSGQVVRVARRPADSVDFTEIGTDVSDSAGRYEFAFRAFQNADYIASVDQSASCAAADAGPVQILVRVLVFLGASDTDVPSGERVALEAIVQPCGNHATTMLELRGRTGRDRPPRITLRALDRRCEASFERVVRVTTRFVAVWEKQDNDHSGGGSNRVVVKVSI